MAGDGDHGFSKLMEHWTAGLLATMRELTLFFAPNINSYKRFVEGSFAPTAVAWGLDNRTCALRVVGHGPSLRVENRVPGRRREPVPRGRGDHRRRAARHRERARARADADRQRLHLGRAARAVDAARRAPTCSPAPQVAKAAFGDDVVAHYLNNARVELAAYDAAVTDWERVRGFERF